MADTKISLLTEVTAPTTTDVLPIVNSATTKKVSVSNLTKAGLPDQTDNSGKFLTTDGSGTLSWDTPTGGSGDVTGPASSTTNHIPQFSDTTGKVLKDGLAVVTTLGSPGTDTNIPTEAATRAAIASAGGGDVSGPASSTNLNIAVFSGTSGKLLADGGSAISSLVPTTRTVNSKSLSSNITLSASDVGAIATGGAYTDLSTSSKIGTGSTQVAAGDHTHATYAPIASPTFTGTVTLPTGLTGVLRADSGVVSTDSDVTDLVSAASTSAAGKIKTSTSSTVNTGTATDEAITPDALAGSNLGIRYVAATLNGTTALTTSEKAYFRIPAAFNGMNLVSVAATVGTGAAGSSSSGTPTFTVKNVTDNNQMLSTSLTVDATEYTSATAATAAVIDTTKDDVATDDLIEVACTTAGTGVTYATITMGFQLP